MTKELWLIFPSSKLTDSIINKIADSTLDRISRGIIGNLKIPAVNRKGTISFVKLLGTDILFAKEALISSGKLKAGNDRFLVIIAEGAKQRNCNVVYTASAIDLDCSNYLHLQDNVERCLLANLNSLDDTKETHNWSNNFLEPMLSHVDRVLLDKEIKL